MVINNIPYILLYCLSLTTIIECIGAFILGVRYKKDLINIVLVNILTNPVLVMLLICCNSKEMYVFLLIILEILAFLIEGIIYKKVLFYKKIKPFVLSLILNIMSYTIGYFIDLLVF